MKHLKLMTLFSIVGYIGLIAVCKASPLAEPISQATLQFDPTHYVVRTISVNNQSLTVRAYEHISYVAKPLDPMTQVMNIFIPEIYFKGGHIGIYTAKSAPIFFPNYIGGYMPAPPGTLDGKGMPGPPDKPNTIAEALVRGYVVATPGARGRISRDANGKYIGKAPTAIVDLKAAVRYLRFNDSRMPGDAEKIISNGTSAGGALSSLLGASGNSSDYEADLKALGAVQARDDIFAVSAYCPIANLEHADAAYEWQFNGINDYKKIDIKMLDFKVERKEIAGTMTADEIRISNELKPLFPAYVNSLKLRDNGGELLSLDSAGNGSFKEYVKSQVVASAQRALDQGKDLSSYAWLRIDGKTVRGIDYDGYLHYIGRMKVAPAFDGLDLGTGENQLFGNERIDKRHFTAFSASHNTVQEATSADAHTVAMMNPMNYIGTSGVTTAAHWRIRHGTYDKDTSLAIPTLLALALENHGIAVDFALPWDRPHSGDYDLDELFAWMERVVTKPSTESQNGTPSGNVPRPFDGPYGGADKSYDTELIKLRELIAPRFQTLKFADKVTGKTMTYNLYTPANYDPQIRYPLVFFMADASTVGKGPVAPLKQGYGGIIWATDQSQAKHPSFVLVPSYKGPGFVVNDDWEVSDEVGMTLRLLNSVVSQYSVDKNRIYTTGQSMGGMISFYLNANHPELFAASLFVGSQWDVNVLAPLANKRFFYIVSAGDPKASAGMRELGEMLKEKGVTIGTTKFSAKLPDVEQEKAIRNLIAEGHAINFVQFDAATVTPDGAQGPGAEHMYSFDYAYQLEAVRDWLFQQSKPDAARLLREKCMASHDDKRAFACFMQLAETGNGDAQQEVGYAWQHGKGVAQDFSKAVSWYQKAIANGSARAMLSLGIMYFEGTGIAQDYVRAADLFRQSWQLGDRKAPRYLGIINEEGLGVAVNYAEALRFYKAASSAGDITAAARIGSLYERGLGVKQSYKNALHWYLVAAPSPEESSRNIHPRVFALNRLGYFYEKGLGIEQDITQAITWYQVAAKDNDAEAKAAIKRLSSARGAK